MFFNQIALRQGTAYAGALLSMTFLAALTLGVL